MVQESASAKASATDPTLTDAPTAGTNELRVKCAQACAYKVLAGCWWGPFIWHAVDASQHVQQSVCAASAFLNICAVSLHFISVGIMNNAGKDKAGEPGAVAGDDGKVEKKKKKKKKKKQDIVTKSF